jgi:hypothetical protein
MGRPEKHPVPASPALCTPQVSLRLAWCRRRLEALQGERATLALMSALGKPRADERLATLGRRIVAMEFEISCSLKAADMASQRDREAMANWRAKLQNLPIEKVIAGVSRENCCALCATPAGCIITGSDPLSGGGCAHPVREGGPGPQYQLNPRVQEIYWAACARLRVKPKAWTAS